MANHYVDVDVGVDDDACGKCTERAFLAMRENRGKLLIASGFLSLVAFVESCMYPTYLQRHPSINSPLVTMFVILGSVGLLLSLILYSDNLHAFGVKHFYRAPGSGEEGPPPYPGRGQPGDASKDRTYDTVPL